MEAATRDLPCGGRKVMSRGLGRRGDEVCEDIFGKGNKGFTLRSQHFSLPAPNSVGIFCHSPPKSSEGTDDLGSV